jgi:hypothetical protein
MGYQKLVLKGLVEETELENGKNGKKTLDLYFFLISL